MKIPANLITIPLDFKGKKHFTPVEYAEIKKVMKERGYDFVKAYNFIYNPEIPF